MPSDSAAGAAPLIAGIVLAFLSAGEIVRRGLSPWAVLGLIGSGAAVVVGARVLLGREGVASGADGPDRRSRVVLAGLAALGLVAGAVWALA